MKSALSEEDAASLLGAIDSALTWLDDNQSADKEEYESQRKELEEVALPILQRAMQAGAGGGAPGGEGGVPPGGDGGGEGGGDAPSVEEVD